MQFDTVHFAFATRGHDDLGNGWIREERHRMNTVTDSSKLANLLQNP